MLVASTPGAGRRAQGTLVEARADLVVTHETIAAHAMTMRSQGVRLLQLATGSMNPLRDHWVTDARQMVADGARLETTARMIDSQTKLLGEHPGQAVRSDLSFVHDTGTALVAEGGELVTHGQAMREHELAELASVSDADLAPAGTALVSADPGRLIDAGVGIRTVGAALQLMGDRFMRSLGR